MAAEGSLSLLPALLERSTPADQHAQADYLFNRGLLAERQAQTDSAFRFFTSAYQLYQRLYPGAHLKKARCLTFLASLQIDYAPVYDSVVFAIYRAGDAFKAKELAPYKKECLLNQAYLARTKRNHTMGEALCDEAIKLAENKETWRDTLFLAECHSEKGMQIRKQDNPAAAEAHLKLAWSLSESYPNCYQRQYFYQNLLLYHIQNANTTGARLFPPTLAALKALVKVQGRDLYALPDRLEGFFAYYQRDYSQLIACYQRALRQLTPAYPSFWFLSDELNFMLTHGYRMTKNYEMALYHEREMFKAGTPLMGQTLGDADMVRPEVYGQVTNPFVPFSQMAEIYLERYQVSHKKPDLERANRFYELTDSLMTAALLEKDEAQILTFQQDMGNNNYADALRAAHQLYENGDSAKAVNLAFRYIERQKSLVLFQDLIRQSLSDDPGWIALMDSLNETDGNIRYLEWAKQREEADPATRAAYSTQLGRAKDKRRDLLENCQRDYPDFLRAVNKQTIPSVETVLGQLADTQAVLQYSLRDPALGYALCLSKKGVRFAVFKQDDTFKKQVQNYLGALSQRNGIKQAVQSDYRASATWLYAQLVQPFEDLLPHGGGELIVIPDNILHQVPFDAFLTRASVGKGRPFYKNAAYLAKDMGIAVSPSWKIREHRLPTGQPVKEVLAYTYGDSKSHLALYAWKKEIQVIREHFTLTLRSGKKCKAQNFLQEAFGHEAIHLLLHGQSSMGSRRDNKLYFGIQTDQEGVDTLGDILYGFQIATHGAKTRLAVLSACETALGDNKTGEGAYTLTRCFLQAGVSEVVASLWAIDDAASARLMTHFYRRLQNGGTAARALHQAKLDFLETSTSDDCFPGFWAGLCAFN